MNNCKNIVEYCGESEWKRIGKYVAYSRKHQTAKDESEAVKEALLRLDGSSISKKSFYVICSYLIFGRDDIKFFPSDYDFEHNVIPWRGISNKLTKYCGVACDWDLNGKLKIEECSAYYCPLLRRWILCDGKLD